MSYTEEEIKKNLDILHNYKVEREGVIGGTVGSPISKCLNCPNTEYFTIDSGFKICDECGIANGHVLGLFDLKTLIDYIIEKRVFIIGSITMRKRLIRFLN